LGILTFSKIVTKIIVVLYIFAKTSRKQPLFNIFDMFELFLQKFVHSSNFREILHSHEDGKGHIRFNPRLGVVERGGERPKEDDNKEIKASSYLFSLRSPHNRLLSSSAIADRGTTICTVLCGYDPTTLHIHSRLAPVSLIRDH
jgi:hypothetical protein